MADSVYLDDPEYWMTAPEDATKARIRFGVWQEGAEPAHPTDFDDFYFDAVPEPSSFIMLLSGLALFFARKIKLMIFF